MEKRDIDLSSITQDVELDELDVKEENDEIYRWVCILVGMIWILSLIFH